MKTTLSLLSLFLASALSQEYDILIRGGNVIDPKNNIDAILDVAVSDGVIAAVEANIDPTLAERVVDATGLFVTPGLIDMHFHQFFGTNVPDEGTGRSYADSPTALHPDGFSFRSGVTTAIDPGAGWRHYRQFKEQVVETSLTRVLSWIEIVGAGMSGENTFEQNVNDMDPRMTALTAMQYDEIIGVKVAHFAGFDFTPVRRAVEAGEMAGIPVMVDFGDSVPELSLEQLLLEELRPGDIFTHCYSDHPGRETIVDKETDIVQPFAFAAKERGVRFDVGHGGGSFRWSQAIPAVQQGFTPTSISTDLHYFSMNAGMKDMTNVMSKFLLLGFSFQEIIELSTWAPAQHINRTMLGNLDIGAGADIAVFNIRDGDFGFIDSGNFMLPGTRKIETELTLRDGAVVWDLNGIAAPQFDVEKYKKH